MSATTHTRPKNSLGRQFFALCTFAVTADASHNTPAAAAALLFGLHHSSIPYTKVSSAFDKQPKAFIFG